MEEMRADFQRIIVQVCKAFLGYDNVLRRVAKSYGKLQMFRRVAKSTI